jgi:hypothetical protein
MARAEVSLTPPFGNAPAASWKSWDIRGRKR